MSKSISKKSRADGRMPDVLRKVTVHRGFTKSAAGSVLIKAGDTHVLCTASIEESVPKWREAAGLGWVTAEYDMLPASTDSRRPRNRTKVDGRTQEIQRLIGRSMRAIVDMAKLGPRTIWIDCDVIQADGGTRTASITGAYLALVDAVRRLRKDKVLAVNPIVDSVAAVSVGIVEGRILLDLNYVEDRDAEVDFNVVQTGSGRFIEVQGTAEGKPFGRLQMNKMLALAEKGIRQLKSIQSHSLGARGK
ncbi:MAG: ribonuclease PH [Planctomycetia bacterium]|nr:ribonuclease PH [Planctomycetia bacterium]MCC7313643.1 ribonuclease PH [Planctomycetota bacterium]OQZ04284.1 MAG: ribonuclease PH [Planctomycetes bacterium UTPLA1]